MARLYSLEIHDKFSVVTRGEIGQAVYQVLEHWDKLICPMTRVIDTKDCKISMMEGKTEVVKLVKHGQDA